MSGITENWPDVTKKLAAQLRNLRGGVPEVMKGFATLAQTALASKALDAKTKELIALAIAVAVRCDDCIGFHAKAAVEQGASPEEVAETLGMAIYMGAGPSVMYASHALEAFNQFANGATNSAEASRKRTVAAEEPYERRCTVRYLRHSGCRFTTFSKTSYEFLVRCSFESGYN